MRKFTISTRILFALIFSFTLLKAQDRVNRTKLKFEKASDKIEEATGWSYNTKIGEWVDYPNLISENKNYKERYTDITKSYLRSLQSQSFNSLQTKSISYQGKKYIVFIVERWSGEYEYPALEQNWIEFIYTAAFIFDYAEYNKLTNLMKDTLLKTRCITHIGSRFESYDETKFLDYIQTAFEDYSIKNREYIMPLSKTDNGKLRFCLPQYYPLYTIPDITEEYFEIDFSELSKLYLK